MMSEYQRIEHGTKNVFGIENPHTYYCQVVNYHVGHSEMRISLRYGDLDKVSYLFLAGVMYFEGTPSWSGANFTTAPQSQCVALLAKIVKDKELVEDIADHTYLYLIDIPDGQIKILAGQGEFLTRVKDYEQSKAEKLLDRIKVSQRENVAGIFKKYDPITRTYIQGEVSPANYDIASSVDQILKLFEEGYTQKDIMALCSWLEPEDIQACLVYARRAISKSAE